LTNDAAQPQLTNDAAQPQLTNDAAQRQLTAQLIYWHDRRKTWGNRDPKWSVVIGQSL